MRGDEKGRGNGSGTHGKLIKERREIGWSKSG